ncbi:trophoblast glycoprotein-like [Bufo bufo]|uniref:trophoblast glycoprotein-like n=1 Tax=Bufo bufo TaxID=8384 RepID=UPI001ABEB2A5|nr:trophoblast glycoprotein-like [Bufo bufo]
MPRRFRLNRHGNLIITTALLSSSEAHSSLVLKLFGMLVLVNVTLSCPLSCYCHNDTGLVQCHVVSPQQDFPEDVPRWVQNLSVTGSNISVLQGSFFRRYGAPFVNLTTLLLTNNNIRAIESEAFVDLPNLTTLDLSNNPLESLSNSTFFGLGQLETLKLNNALREVAQNQLFNSPWTEVLRNLRTLELTGNDLQAFPKNVLDLRSLKTIYLGNNSIKTIDKDTTEQLKEIKLQVYLNPNPIACDCKTVDMILWLKNTSQTSEAQSLQCASPQNLNGTLVFNFKTDNMKCISKELETASYVFFGIVLALIGVIFLMVLYLNRRGIKRWLNNFREACRDQMEGYHYRYEQDSDPRRSNASTGI